MNKTKFISLTAGLMLALAFTLSCSLVESGGDSSSSSGGNSFSYCLINGHCLNGSFTSKVCGDLGGLPSNSCNGGGGEVPRDIIPDEIRDKIEDKMPLYTGTTPPDIIGQYPANPLVLVGSSLSDDVIGMQFADIYAAFVIGSNGKLSYQEKSLSSSGESDDVLVEVVGSSNNFTAYFTKTGVSSGVNVKHSTIISGTLTSNGISDFHYAFVMLEKGPDPTPVVVPVNTYRIFKDDDGLAANYNWL